MSTATASSEWEKYNNLFAPITGPNYPATAFVSTRPGSSLGILSESWMKRWRKVTAEAVIGKQQEEPSLREELVAFRELSLSDKEKRSAFLAAVLAEAGKQQEENVNYLFEVFVIDLENQELAGSHYVICSNVSRAVTVATLRHELKEDELSSLKLHVHKICEVPAWDGD